MEIQSISKEKRECTIRLSVDELVMICNSFHYVENKYESSCLFHKLYSEMIIANNLCQYGHIDNFYSKIVGFSKNDKIKEWLETE